MANFSSRLMLAAWCGLAAIFASPGVSRASDMAEGWPLYCSHGDDLKADCIRAARSYGLSGDAVARTCAKATPCSRDCIRIAWDYELKSELMVQACGNQPVEATSPCIRTGWHEGIRGEPLARMCRGVRQDVTDCIRTAVSEGLSVEQVVATCGGNAEITDSPE